MATIILMAIIWVTFALPALAARHPNPRKALRGMTFWFAIFVAIYFYYVAYGHTRFFPPS